MEEQKKYQNRMDLTNEDLVKLQLNSINASFASKEVKDEVIERIIK